MEVMRVEAKSIDDISYGGGLVARLDEGTTATVTRAADWRGRLDADGAHADRQGRAVLFRKLVVDYAIEWFDYRRLPQESLTPFLDARVQGEASRRPQ